MVRKRKLVCYPKLVTLIVYICGICVLFAASTPSIEADSVVFKILLVAAVDLIAFFLSFLFFRSKFFYVLL